MVERYQDDTELTIRFHHLDLWKDVVSKYLKDFKGILPWDLTREQALTVRFFAQRIANDLTFQQVDVQKYFEDSSFFSYLSEEAGHLRYSYDVIGKDDASYQKVCLARADAIMKVFDAARRDKNTKVLLTIESDDYCRACSVGEHCKRSRIGYLLKHDADFFYRNVVGFLTGSQAKASIEIPASLLFDLGFHELILGELKKRYPSWYQ